jgi:signal transduction histidine kinase
MLQKLLEYVPHGNTLDAAAYRRRHRLLLWVLFIHVPGLWLFGFGLGRGMVDTAYAIAVPAACVLGGWLFRRQRRLASFLVTVGLTYSSAALVGLSNGSIEAHFHFFIIIGFIALYQDWVPFLWNIAFTVLSHGLGSGLRSNLIFNHPAGQVNPWVWSAIHGVAVLAACGGVVIFWKTTEEEQQKTIALTERLADEELQRRRFTSDLLVNLARRNQSLLYRQLDVINQLEEHETDPDALSGLFRVDHLATRIRRNAESLLVLSGEKPPRTWTRPVPLVDVVRAAIAETEDLDRVVFAVDERLAVSGGAVADLTHLLAELIENAVRFSPPDTTVTVATRPRVAPDGGYVLTVEDWGVGMRPSDLAEANELLAVPREVDLSVSQRLGLHVVARLAQRHGIDASLTATPGGGVTAVVGLPASIFTMDVGGPVTAASSPALSQALPPAPPPPRHAAPPSPALSGRDGDGAPPPRHARGLFGTALTGGDPSDPPPPGPAEHDPRPDVAAPAGPPPAWAASEPPYAAGAPTTNGTGPGRFPAVPDTPAPAGRSDQPSDQPFGVLRPVASDGPYGPVAGPVGMRQARLTPRPAPARPSRAEESPDPWARNGAEPTLERRVPQTHLVPQLRRDPDAPEPVDGSAPDFPMPNPAQARAALSRYQASRQAARALIERTAADGDGSGGVDGGGR